MIIPGARLCCTAPSGSVYTEGDDAILIFKGEPDLPYGYQGFVVKFRTCKISVIHFPTKPLIDVVGFPLAVAPFQTAREGPPAI